MQEDGIGKDRQMETEPSVVPGASGAKQGGEIRARWAWVEPSVWTDRMLMALDRGVKGGVWFSLMDGIRAKTRRTNGHSLSRIIKEVNAQLRGWFAYFKECHGSSFPPIDQWVRMRLRSILRKRNGGKGRGDGLSHWRWPNAYFDKQGLFCLVMAHAQVHESPCG